jgi:type I restriction enzyme, S subunit
VLGVLDDKIEATVRMNETLEGVALATFKSWFDPVLADIEDRTSAVAQLPTGWQSGTLGDLCTLKRGYDLPAAQRGSGNIPIVSSSGISGMHSTSKVKAPGVVTGRYGTIGQVFFIESEFWPLNTALYVSDFHENEPRVVYYMLRSVDFSKFMDKAAVPGVNRNDLHQEPISIPPKTLQQRFTHTLNPIWNKQRLNRQHIETIATLRDLLLPKLMSGEIDVGSAKQLLRDAGV